MSAYAQQHHESTLPTYLRRTHQSKSPPPTQTCGQRASKSIMSMNHHTLITYMASTISDPAVQQICHIALQMGRVIGFPNVFHSKLEPFGVADAMQACHQGVLKTHMINPNRPKMGASMVLNRRHGKWSLMMLPSPFPSFSVISMFP